MSGLKINVDANLLFMKTVLEYESSFENFKPKEWTQATEKSVKIGIKKGYVVRDESTQADYLKTTALSRVVDLLGPAVTKACDAYVYVTYKKQYASNRKHVAVHDRCCMVTFLGEQKFCVRWSGKGKKEKAENDMRESPKKKTEKMVEKQKTTVKRETSVDDLNTQLLKETENEFLGNSNPEKNQELLRLLNERETNKQPTASTSTATEKKPLEPLSIDTELMKDFKSLSVLDLNTSGMDKDALIDEKDIERAKRLFYLMHDMKLKRDAEKGKMMQSASSFLKDYRENSHKFETEGDLTDKTIVPELASFVSLAPVTTELVERTKASIAVSLAKVEKVRNFLATMDKSLSDGFIFGSDRTVGVVKCIHCPIHCSTFLDKRTHAQANRTIKNAEKKLKEQKTKPRKAQRKPGVAKQGRPHNLELGQSVGRKRTKQEEPQPHCLTESSASDEEMSLSSDSDL